MPRNHVLNDKRTSLKRNKNKEIKTKNDFLNLKLGNREKEL